MVTNMLATRIDPERLELRSMPEVEFFKKHVRMDVKYHDSVGKFGPEKFDYFMYVNKDEVESDGYSYVYILLFTPRSVERMNEEVKSLVISAMAKNNFDFEKIIKQGHVVYAIDDASTTTCSSLFVPFIRREK